MRGFQFMRGRKEEQRFHGKFGLTREDGRIRHGWIYAALALLALGFCAIFVLRFGVFGSRVDWVNQHSVFPDYFRQRFYETKDLFPDYAWNLGAGQNIYSISYYGLFSPVILLSYVLPFIPMDCYIMGSSILSYVASVLLMYYWLRSHSCKAAFAGAMTVYFSLSTSLVYQFYNQIMFVNYMPFLCLALIGTDRFLRMGKRRLLLYGVLGMILTSFYFSIGGMLALCLYALAEYLTQLVSAKTRKGTAILKATFLMGIRYVGQLLSAILISGILLVPTALVIAGGERSQEIVGQDAMKLIEFNPTKLLYSPYGAGMTLLVIVAVIGGILCTKKWTEKVLPVGLFLLFAFPMVGILLNGGLYEKTKVFIPFVPLLVLQAARYIRNSVGQNASFRLTLPWILMIFLLLYARNDPAIEKYELYVLLEMVCCGISFWAAREKKRPEIAVLSSILCLLCIHMWLHPAYDRMLDRGEYASLHDRQWERQIAEIHKKDPDFYRTEVFGTDQQNHNYINRLASIGQNITSLYSSCYNQEYLDFRKHIFHINEPFRNNMMQSVTNNPCFLQFMGVKYHLRKQTSGGEWQIIKNDLAAPVWYVTDQVITEEEYQKCSFPECQTMLLQRSVVEAKDHVDLGKKSKTNLSVLPKMTRKEVKLPEQDSGSLSIRSVEEGTYQICANKEMTCSIPLTGLNQNDDLLAVSFRMTNKHPHKDVFIQLNQQTNKLSDYEYGNHNDTFYYMVPLDKNQEMQIVFGRGEYEIADWQVYSGCLAALQNHELVQQPVRTDLHGPQGDRVSGRVSCQKPGVLVTSIPYDENFELTLDGKQVDLIRVNTSFLGAKVEAGEHVICLEYHAPGKRAGWIMTFLGLLLFEGGGILHYVWRHRKIPKRSASKNES